MDESVTYHKFMINIQTLIYASESYTYENWVFRDISVGFSRLYYIIDGEAYYEENGQKIRLKKNQQDVRFALEKKCLRALMT